MDQVLVSVIMPVYNCAAYIEQALESALYQDVPLEVIVINDCSKDNLDRVMQRYESDRRVRYMKY